MFCIIFIKTLSADRLKERTALADALVVLAGIIADDIRSLHFHTKFFLGEVDGRENGQIGVALAAARATDVSYFTKRLCRHLM